MTYSEKLRNPRWQKKRLDILQRDNFSCTLCGDKETTLHVHHLKYNGDPWQTDDEFLTTYCECCHMIVEDFKGANFSVVAISKNTNTNKSAIINVVDSENTLWFLHFEHLEQTEYKILARLNESGVNCLVKFLKSNIKITGS